MPDPERVGVLFICLGNICRSPLAEGVFLHKINQGGNAARYRVDSAGLGAWHIGERPDPRSCAVANTHGVALPGRARRVESADFERFEHLICMDQSNREGLLDMGAPEDRVRLLLTLDDSTHLHEVPDPYYGGEDGFRTIYTLIDSACEALLIDLQQRHS